MTSTATPSSAAHAPPALTEPLDPRPVILLGAHRSGTTMLGQFFAQCPDVAFLEEPRYIWTWGNAYTEDDVLTEEHARLEVVNYIRERFNARLRKSRKSRFAEKTPSNCLRVPFIRAVYPEARFIHIIRDGRAVVRSTIQVLHAHPPMWRIAERALRTSPREWLAYAPRAVRQLARKFTGKPMQYWGPRPPGWREWAEHDPQHVMVAKQWAASALTAAREGRRMPASQRLEVRYEALMESPRDTLREMFRFADLRAPDELVERLSAEVDPSRKHAWRDGLTAQQLDEMRPHLEPALNELGYAW